MAVRWCRMAADRGDAPGQNDLGCSYEPRPGHAPGPGAGGAVVPARRAAGLCSCPGQTGPALRAREGVPRDWRCAAHWYRLVMLRGEPRGGMKARGAVGEDGVNSVRGRGGLARLGGGFCPLSVGSDRTCRPIYLQIFIRYGTYRSIVQIGSKVSQIRTSKQIRLVYIAAMGEELGEHFHGLWEEVVDLHLHWREYVDLFSASPERVSLLNQSASSFFARLDGIMWEQTILHIYRLTDSPRRGELKRLTLNALPDLVASSIKKVVRRHLDVVRRKAVFCRDWRERLLAHRDLDLAVGHGATPLILGSRKQVEEILLDMSQILNLIAEHYTQSSLSFEITRYSGAERLIRVLCLGLMMEQRRIGQMDAGGIPDGGYRLPYL